MFILADHLLRKQDTIYSAWIGLPEPFIAELCARAGFDAVCLDTQHGMIDQQAALRAVPLARLAGVPSIVRIGVGDFRSASHALDAGAEAVIAPMINSREEAEGFAFAMKFPPLGQRSWGPDRAIALFEETQQSYLEKSNRETLAFAMIETAAAITALDSILDVDGIDGIFVGPSDLSLALSAGSVVDPYNPAVEEAIAFIFDRVVEAGKIPAIYAANAELAKVYQKIGYRLIALSSDVNYLISGIQKLLQDINN